MSVELMEGTMGRGLGVFIYDPSAKDGRSWMTLARLGELRRCGS